MPKNQPADTLQKRDKPKKNKTSQYVRPTKEANQTLSFTINFRNWANQPSFKRINTLE